MHNVQDCSCRELHSVQCEGMNLPDTFKRDQAAYVDARAQYSEICRQSEASREVALSLRQIRFAAFDKKIEAAENLLMCVQGLYRTHLNALGLWAMYEEMTAGQGSRTMLIKIADETAKL